MDSNIVIKDSLIYYDEQNQESFLKKNKIKYYKINFNTGIIYFYTKDKKPLITQSFEIVGMYNNNDKSWIWGWNLHHIRNNLLFVSRAILNRGLDIDIADKNNITNTLLKLELTTSRFRVQNKIQLDIHLGVFMYLSKKKNIIPIKITENTMKNISQLEKINYNIEKDDIVYYIVLILSEKLLESIF